MILKLTHYRVNDREGFASKIVLVACSLKHGLRLPFFPLVQDVLDYFQIPVSFEHLVDLNVLLYGLTFGLRA